ncbi:MAG: 4-alpha-glucanotransferase [Nostocoides sp.]
MPQHTPPSRLLADLASAHGVATDYWDWQGRHTPVSAETIMAVLTALGVDTSSEESTQAALAETVDGPWRAVLPPTVILRAGGTPRVPVHVERGATVHAWIALEDGHTRDIEPVDRSVEPRRIEGRLLGEVTLELPGDLPLGWHTLHVEVDDDSTATSTVVVTPTRLELPESLREGRVWGLMTQLYQVRSARSWGIGDLADLAELASWGAGLGAEFVLVNPLHAAEPSGHLEPSPYLPTTRRFANPIYLRVEDLPEIAYLSPTVRAEVESYAASARALNEVDGIDRDAAWAAKRKALEVVFGMGLTGHRSADFNRYVAAQGEGLQTFATWCALADEHGADWTMWPEPLRNRESAAVAAYVIDHPDQVRFHGWLQWLLDEEMAGTQRSAVTAGMSLGIVNDLAVGVHPKGADAWGLSSVLAHGVTVGAPPDQFNQRGQNWHQPPWHPGRLAQAGYAPFRDMVRAVLKDSGGIRVDHVIGLFRLWWVPEGSGASEGAYVRYDYEALLGILVLEAQRAGAVVVGEDLGVVEPMARDVLRDRGVLGTSILWFEWTPDGRPLPPEDYRDLCLASVTTHDLPPTAGYLELAHVALRDRLGLLTRSVAAESETEQVAIDKVRDLLVYRGLLEPGTTDSEHVLVALHRCLAHTPARMLGVSLSDLVGDRRIINQPGTDKEYPNWRVPLSGPDGAVLSLEALEKSPLVGRVVDALSRRLPGQPAGRSK